MTTKRICGYLSILTLTLGLLGLGPLMATQSVAFDLDFYESCWSRLSISDNTRMSQEELSVAGKRLLEYVRGKEPTAQLNVSIDGQTRPLYRENEMEHLRDVRTLFQKGFWAKRLFAALVVAGLLTAVYANGLNNLANTRCLAGKSLIAAGLLLVIGTLLLALPAASDFDGWWTNFHVLTFDNELWRLDPAQDWLIKMFPEDFFYSAAKQIAKYSVIIGTSYFVLGIMLTLPISHFTPDNSKNRL